MTQKNRKKTVLVWVTNPSACESIVRAGRELADRNQSELVVVSIQPSIRGNWEERTNDLEQLHNAAKLVEAELTVIYSDNRLEATFKTIRDVAPDCMVVGLRGVAGQSGFLDQLSHVAGEIPIYSVDLSGNMVRIGCRNDMVSNG